MGADAALLIHRTTLLHKHPASSPFTTHFKSPNMSNAMHLSSPDISHITQIMTWFRSAQALSSWAGPNFRYPFTTASFTADLNLESLASFVLLDDSKELLGFGQCYERVGRCHIGRLAIAPHHRGKALVGELIEQLCNYGLANSDCHGCSLFVMQDNVPALRAYQRLGFTTTAYPAAMPLDNCLYMTRLS